MTNIRRLAVGIACIAWPSLGLAGQHVPLSTPPLSKFDIACAPGVSARPPDAEPRVVGSPDGLSRAYFARADTLVIDRGHQHGIDLGQEYFVRRVASDGAYGARMLPILQTAGWVQIVSTESETSLATVVHACGALRPGDFLEPAVWPPDLIPSPMGDPDYARPGVILFGLDGRSFIATNEYFVFGLGTMLDVVPGQRLTVFRRPITNRQAGIDLGDAVIVRVDLETASATARLLRARDAVEAGDQIAPHR